MLGHWEIIAIIVIALLIFGPKKIPELMKGIGRGLREFKNSMKDDSDDEDTNKKQPYDDGDRK
ncbi:MAG TPA: twin-arginine translocase TatA/TatE family subunit [Candidatus Sumerlaeota bacterium]|nr:twin-arginine translocase TatA/TatE family subunit [Candidatus Sumerlaeota bacterium]